MTATKTPYPELSPDWKEWEYFLITEITYIERCIKKGLTKFRFVVQGSFGKRNVASISSVEFTMDHYNKIISSTDPEIVKDLKFQRQRDERKIKEGTYYYNETDSETPPIK